MISTVTTSTVAVITLAGSFSIIGVLILLTLLVQKEIAGSAVNKQIKRVAKILNIGIAPLLIAFVLIVAGKVVEIISR
jgi:hypothetical protein